MLVFFVYGTLLKIFSNMKLSMVFFFFWLFVFITGGKKVTEADDEDVKPVEKQ